MISVFEYLENSREKYPSKAAIIEKDLTITYEELYQGARKVGRFVHNRVDGSRNPVDVFMDKGINALTAFWGILCSGNFYSMANVDLPDDRIKAEAEVLQTELIFTTKNYYDRACLIFGDERVELIEDVLGNLRYENEKGIETAATDSGNENDNNIAARSSWVDVNPLYANFTSGSTGVPKAVLVSHRSVIDFIGYFTDIFGIGENDIIANQAPFDFDVSVKDIYSAAKAGATLVIVPKEYFSNPAMLIDYLVEKEITTMIWAVSALSLVSTFHGLDYKTPKTVNKVLFSGETMPIKHLRDWMNHLQDAVFVNLYGPTEITCNCTYHVIDRDRSYDNGIPIGRPFPNEDVILLDSEGKEIVSPNEEGEICVRGTALALGYYNSMSRTLESFVQNPTNTKYPELIYKTGDVGYFNEKWELMFKGRVDFQIKYMGHRIELEEIELAINKVSEVSRAVVVFDEEKSKLICYYIGAIDKKDLHKKLRESLPIFMVPGRYKQVSEFPLTKNGKVDRKKLS